MHGEIMLWEGAGCSSIWWNYTSGNWGLPRGFVYSMSRTGYSQWLWGEGASWGRSEHCSREWGLECAWESLDSSSCLKRKEEGFGNSPLLPYGGSFNTWNESHHNQEWPDTSLFPLRICCFLNSHLYQHTAWRSKQKNALHGSVSQCIGGEKKNPFFCSVCSSLFWCIF